MILEISGSSTACNSRLPSPCRRPCHRPVSRSDNQISPLGAKSIWSMSWLGKLPRTGIFTQVVPLRRYRPSRVAAHSRPWRSKSISPMNLPSIAGSGPVHRAGGLAADQAARCRDPHRPCLVEQQFVAGDGQIHHAAGHPGERIAPGNGAGVIRHPGRTIGRHSDVQCLRQHRTVFQQPWLRMRGIPLQQAGATVGTDGEHAVG